MEPSYAVILMTLGKKVHPCELCLPLGPSEVALPLSVHSVCMPITLGLHQGRIKAFPAADSCASYLGLAVIPPASFIHHASGDQRRMAVLPLLAPAPHKCRWD